MDSDTKAIWRPFILNCAPVHRVTAKLAMAIARARSARSIAAHALESNKSIN